MRRLKKSYLYLVRAKKHVGTGVCARQSLVSQPHPGRANRAATPRRNSTMCEYQTKIKRLQKEKDIFGLLGHRYA